MSESLRVLDNIHLNFNQEGLFFLNITLAFIMFGVALELDFSSFKKVFLKPKAAIIGIISQFLLLPAVTFFLILLIKPSPGVALGMILVAACPGGNISNFISSLGKANIALSITLTAIATLAAVFMTPINFAFWGGLYAKSSPLLQPIEIDSFQMFQTVFILIGIPLILGISFSRKFPKTTKKIIKPVKLLSILIFMGFVVIALANNYNYFKEFIHLIILIVLAHNALALSTGYLISTIFKLPKYTRRSITIETGIQNSGLALVLIFNPKIFSPDLELGGMAFIAAWWGIWHIISGLAIAGFWSIKAFNK
ncbi:MAG: bile acid:sodium symporter family protein [Bacteroidota bacterium]|nr:bile acid:sodium symporter family protein [Bacteroidota bacterium]